MKKISQISPLQRGYDLPNRSLIEGDFPVVYSNGIGNYHNAFIKKGPGIVTGRSGTIGKLFFVRENYWPHNTSLFVTDFKGNDPKYLFYLLYQVKLDQFATGSGVPTLNRNDVHDSLVPLPPFAEQKAISTALSDMDAYIRSLEQLIEKKKAIKQAAMQELLTPKEDWEVKEIGGLIDLLTGFPFPSSKYSETGIKLLRGSNIKRGNTDWDEEITQYWPELTSQLKAYVLQEGDIVIAMDGSLVGKSFAQLNKDDIPALLLQRVARVRTKKISTNYLKEFICSDIFTKHCDAVKTSSAIPHISPEDIRKFKIPIPPLSEIQEMIASTLRSMSSEIISLDVKLEKVKLLKQAMMQDLLTGKVRLV